MANIRHPKAKPDEEEGYLPEPKDRPCQGSNCKARIRSRFPGVCEKCKKCDTWQSGLGEYSVRASTSRIREGFNR